VRGNERRRFVKRTFIGVIVAGLALAGTAAGAAFALGNSSVTSRTTDAIITTTANTNLSSTGGAETVIESLSLPKGKWILHADNTVVDFTGGIIDRCAIFSGATSLDSHAVSGGLGAIFGDSESAAAVLTGTTTVSVQCEADSSGSTAYIDAGADLWAHKASSLDSETTP
jgi:hypothetical protein